MSEIDIKQCPQCGHLGDHYPARGAFQNLGSAPPRFIERHLSRGHQLQDPQPFLHSNCPHTKLDNLCLGLALLFHLIAVADTQIPVPGQSIAEAAYVPPWAAWVSLPAVQRATAWCSFLEAHARRCYALVISPELAAAQALAKKLCNGELADGFTARDVFRRGWRDLATLKVVAAALEWLEEEGWIRSYEAGSGHRGGADDALPS